MCNQGAIGVYNIDISIFLEELLRLLRFKRQQNVVVTAGYSITTAGVGFQLSQLSQLLACIIYVTRYCVTCGRLGSCMDRVENTTSARDPPTKIADERPPTSRFFNRNPDTMPARCWLAWCLRCSESRSR